jgi:hypothetical protein
MNAREISILVRDALLLKEQQQEAQPATLIGELEQEAAATLRTVQGLNEGMTRQRSLWLVNGMQQAIADPDAVIPGTFSRARWAEIEEAFNELAAFMLTPMPVTGVTPLQVIYRRGNPPELAAPQPEGGQGE